MAKPINYSETQRIVLLIDLNPLLQNPDPNPNLNSSSSYITTIVTASKLLLSFPALSSTLFAFKLFFSSLSPITYSSLLPNSLSFDYPSEILSYLTNTLNSLPELFPFEYSPSRASNISKLLLQLAQHHAWEPGIGDVSGTKLVDLQPVVVSSNLIVLFSPVSACLKCGSGFLNVDLNDESLRTMEGFNAKFGEIFGAANDAFVNKEIHFSWVDVKWESDCFETKGVMNDRVLQFRWFQSWIRRMGYGFCSTNDVVLGSALVPFGLIYPEIGVSSGLLNCCTVQKRMLGQLSLQISDVNGKPLECNCCDLELLNPRMPQKFGADNLTNTSELTNTEGEEFEQTKLFLDILGNGTVKLHVKAVQKYAEEVTPPGLMYTHLWVRKSLARQKGEHKSSDEVSTNRVLEILERKTGDLIQSISTPLWQIFLAFLYGKGYWALVTLSTDNHDSLVGILKPFTTDLALLCIVDGTYISKDDLVLAKIDEETCKSHNGDGKGKRNNKQICQDFTWTSLQTAAFEYSELDLMEILLAKKIDSSKKLKFLKCWIKQIINIGCYHLVIPPLNESHQESPQSLDEPCEAQEIVTSFSCSETPETFFSNLPKKIQQGLESKGVDLQTLAERLVNSSIHWLCQKHELDENMEDQTEPIGKTISAELIKLLLREPKELKEKRKDYELLTKKSDQCLTSENVLKEYEWQIFLRMEIIRSEVAESIEESTKQKLIKQICSLLEIIQYLVEGGVHGHLSLFDYVEGTIKTRYSHILEDVVRRIYAQMDLLPFGDEDEPPDFLFNSEDSNQSWKGKREGSEIAETRNSHQSVSGECESDQHPEYLSDCPEGIKKEEHARKLNEARERRERARRFVSFTSWVPDVQRVWAPKQPKAVKGNSDSLHKKSKRKQQRSSYSVVHETPITGKRRSFSRESIKGDEEFRYHGSNSSNSVSKALFQDESRHEFCCSKIYE